MNHRWPDKADWKRTTTSNGNERIARSCSCCGMQKITVISGCQFAKHEWITIDGKVWVGEATPPCLVREVSAL